jgi:ABC-type sugar transport system ATPase subunit
MATAITLRHITKVFGPASGNESTRMGLARSAPPPGPETGYALEDISLTIRPGEVLGVLGPSGCGKTTLLKVVAGLIQPTSGQVLYDNIPLEQIPMRERGIGIVFQSYALYPHLPSIDNIGFFLRLRKREEEIPERVREISEFMRIDLKPLLARKPPTLSGGEKQRIAIARCLARDPKIFLFDEPFSNLDAKLRSSARLELKRLLQKYQVTSIYVTHDQHEAIALSDRIALLNRGRLEQIGSSPTCTRPRPTSSSPDSWAAPP